MQKTSLNSLVKWLRICIAAFILCILSLVIFSFTVNKLGDDIFRQLGIGKNEGDKKISNSILGGYLDAYGARNLKNIALGNRTAVAKDLLSYTKQYVGAESFRKEYAALKEKNKPVFNKVETPEEMRKNMIETTRNSVIELEAVVKRSDASLKPMFEKALADGRKQLADVESPNNKAINNYKKNYDQAVKFNQSNYDQQINRWESLYPTNHLLFVKQRLQEFLEETKDIDFGAELTVKDNKKIFVNRAYERKGNRWKMAFRAGKEVVEPARAFVSQWIAEIQ